MESKSRHFDKIYLPGKGYLLDTLINRIIVIAALFSVIASIIAQLRTSNVGWSSRDLFQLIILCAIVILALFRGHLTTNQKSFCLLFFFSIGGCTGVYTLGMFAGTIFYFQAAIVLSAVFYSTRTTLILISIILTFFILMAVKFCSGTGALTFDPNSLMSNYLHWSVYISCLTFFFAVAYVTIHNYRSAMKELLAKINRQSEDLIKTNQKLLNADKSIKKLSGLLPICSYCKKIRNDKGYWEQLETYISDHSEADFSHSICDNCLKSKFGDDEDL